jgi:hypothetical protein
MDSLSVPNTYVTLDDDLEEIAPVAETQLQDLEGYPCGYHSSVV